MAAFRDIPIGVKFTSHDHPDCQFYRLDEDNPGGNAFEITMGRLRWFIHCEEVQPTASAGEPTAEHS